MRIYLAARYSRRLELCGYRDQIAATGHTVKAVWLDGNHQIGDGGKPIGESGEALVEGDDGSTSEQAASLRFKFANDDYKDVAQCDLLIAFTEPPRSNASRGGRHVELGIALGLGKKVWVVGPRENIFCWLDGVTQFDAFDDALQELRETHWFIPKPPAPRVPSGLVELSEECYQISKSKGFWTGPENCNVPTKLALIHSEVSEMLEAYRKGNPPCEKAIDVSGKRIRSMEEETADVFIRLLDLCGYLDIDLGAVTAAKMKYNQGREHKHGGKRV